jgi:hypothetical protein
MRLRVASCVSASCLLLASTAFAGAGPTPPSLRVAGAKEKLVSLALTSGRTLKRTFRIVADGPGTAADVIVALSPFEDASGAPVTDAVTKTYPAVSVDSPASFDVTAALPRSGKYAGELDLIVAGARSATRVEVDVQTPSLGVRPIGPLAIQGEVGQPHSLELSLEETSERPWALLLPRIAAAGIKGKDRTFQVAVRVGKVTQQAEPVAAPISIGPLADVELGVELEGLDQPGEYEGQLQLRAAGAMPLELPFTATLKESSVTAGWWIGAGALMSMLLRQWFGRWRRKQQLRQGLASLDDRLQKLEPRATSDAARTLVTSLRAQVADLAAQLALDGDVEEVGKAMDRAGKKLPIGDAWLDADPMVARLPDADGRTALRATLDQVAGTLEDRLADDAAIALAEVALRELKVRGQRREAIRGALADTKTAIDKARAGAEPKTLEEIERGFAEAQSLLARDALDDLDGADGGLVKLRRKLASAMTETLKGELRREPPPGMNGPEWQTHVANIEKELEGSGKASTPEAAFDIYNRALGVHLAGIAEALARAAVEKAKGAAVDFPGTSKDLIDLASGLRSAIDRAKTTGGSGSVELADAYRAALRSWPVLIAKASGQDTTARLVSAPGAEPAEMAPVALQPIVRPSVRPTLDLKAARRSLLLFELLAFVGLTIAAIALGQSVLWVDDPTWGGTRSHVIAFAWGLGLFQVGSAAAFDGILGLKDKFAALVAR